MGSPAGSACEDARRRVGASEAVSQDTPGIIGLSFRSEQVDEVVTLFPEACRHCQHPISAAAACSAANRNGIK